MKSFGMLRQSIMRIMKNIDRRLRLIPILAEIFSISSDELLKGERDNNKFEEEKPYQ